MRTRPGRLLMNLPGHLFNQALPCSSTAHISPNAKKNEGNEEGKETYVPLLPTPYQKETEKYTNEKILQPEVDVGRRPAK